MGRIREFLFMADRNQQVHNALPVISQLTVSIANAVRSCGGNDADVVEVFRTAAKFYAGRLTNEQKGFRVS